MEFESLVSKIAKVLSENQQLLRAAVVREPSQLCSCGECTGCGHCASRRQETIRTMVASSPVSRVSSSSGVGELPDDIARLIDHTLLRPDATYGEIGWLCDEAREHRFAAVCVNPMHVRRCAARLTGTSSAVCTVVGFPLGAAARETKALEARRAIRDGARELDMVIAIGALKSGDHRYVYDDICAVAEVARDGGALLKVILETSLLTDEEKVAACVLAKRARADFVKTSTGFAKGGATVHDVALLGRAVDHDLGVKASGGIKTADDASKMIAAGASRIGASVGVAIVKQRKQLASASVGGRSGS